MCQFQGNFRLITTHPERAMHYGDLTKSKCRFLGWSSLPSTLLSCLPHAEPTRFFSPQDAAPLRHSRDPRTPCAPAYTHTTRSTHCVCPLTCTRPLYLFHTHAPACKGTTICVFTHAARPSHLIHALPLLLLSLLAHFLIRF